MLVTFSLLGLLAMAIAAPAPTSNMDIDIANQDSNDHVLHVPTSDNALSRRQTERCDWDNFCLPEYKKCVKSCNSLKNSEW